MGDVLEYLVDGTSGLAPGGVDGKAIVAGVCSKGTVGKAYLIGKRTDLPGMLGTGPLVERLRAMLTTGGQEPVIVAVPVRGQQSGYVTDVVAYESKTVPTAVGLAAKNADIVVKVNTPGGIGDAKLDISIDGGKTFDENVPLDEQVVIGTGDDATGVTLVFPTDITLDADARFTLNTRCAVGPVTRIGDTASPKLEIKAAESGVLAGAELIIQIVKGGGLNEGTYQLSNDGGDNYERVRTIPVDGLVSLADYGVEIKFPEGNYTAGTTYECRVLAPTPSIMDVMEALKSPLSLYDVEFVHVAGPTDSVDWAAAQTKAEDLWNAHRPTYFKMETRLPYDGEDLNDFTAWLLAEKQGLAARFVTVCCQYGEVVDSTGASRLRNAGGLQSGRVMSIPVQRATGRVKDGPVSQLSLPEGWEAIQITLEDAGFLTAK